MEYCSIFFPVNFIPGSKVAGRLNPAASMPNNIAKTGPPMMGNKLPKK